MNCTMNSGYARRINSAVAVSTDEQWAEAVAWYPSAHQLCQQASLDTGYTLDQCAVALAHLSPQLSWTVNRRAFLALVYSDRRESSVIRSSFDRARASLIVADPWSTFSRRANKTRNFALNIAGDEQAVTVDSWIARCLGEDPLKVFRHPALYGQIADAFRRSAKRHHIAPRELQALVWIVTRGRAT